MAQDDNIDPQTVPGGFVLDEAVERDPTRITFTMDEQHKDIEPKIVRRLGQFLSNVTLGNATLENTFTPKANVIPVNDKTEDVVEASRVLYNKAYVPSPATTTLGETLSRGRSPDPSQFADGNTLLEDVDVAALKLPETGGDTPPTRVIKRYTSAVLGQNRFTATTVMSPQVATGNPPSNNYNPSLNITSRTPGKYDKEQQTLYSQHRLAHIGTILSTRGAGEIGSLNAGYNPDDAGAIAKALLPSSVQMGVDRVELKNLDVLDILKDMTSDDVNAENFPVSPGKSWGALNNPLDTFSSMSSLGMVALSFALVASVVVVFEGVLLLLKVAPIKGEGPAASKHVANNRYVFGAYATKLDGKQSGLGGLLKKITPSISHTLGIRPTLHPYDVALRTGLYTFFGMDVPNSSDVLKSVLNVTTSALASAVETPGYNVVAARNIARSTVLLADKFKEIGRSANLLSGLDNVASLLGELKNSKLIAAMNVFASLGDAIIEGDKNVIDMKDGTRSYHSSIDIIPDDSFDASVTKSKRSDGSLAWAGYRTPTALLIPKSIVTFTAGAMSSNTDIIAPNLLSILQNARSNTDYISVESTTKNNSLGSGARIDGSDVEKYENRLDAEYMPFYFHDLRTNEIISFHAFLDTLTDDYSPQWETINGYGRVDPVKIYKSTDRKISIGFHIVSVNVDDHNDMWTKINKLVTLVYPQYSQGRIASTNNKGKAYQFVQPMSQIITSSPVIRLRLGDLLKSNYSKFNVARLFGAGDPSVGMKMNGENVVINDKIDAEKLATFKRDIQTARSTMDTEYQYILRQDGQTPSSFSGISVSLPIPNIASSLTSNANNVNRNASIPPNYLPFVRVVKQGNANSDVVQIEYVAMTSDEITKNYGPGHTKMSTTVAEYLKNTGLTGTYSIKIEDIELTRDSVKKISTKAFGTLVSGIEELAKFLDNNNNAVIRAFNSTKGKGLAGTLDGLNFEWLGNVPWDVTPGRKAPMMCKVTFSFTPIHDISPGIDHMGLNRAAVYPVAAQFSEPPTIGSNQSTNGVK